jgi:hypothetical protein
LGRGSTWGHAWSSLCVPVLGSLTWHVKLCLTVAGTQASQDEEYVCLWWYMCWCGFNVSRHVVRRPVGSASFGC